MKEKPVIIICPGGAYRHLSPRESEPIARAFGKMGLNSEILAYSIREDPDQPPLGLVPVRQLSDCVQKLRKTSPDAPVLVCGFSAGAHLAATLGVHWKKLGLECPDGLILSYPVITANPQYINEESFHNLTGDENREFFSLEKHVSPDIPPVFLWHTASDRDVPVENTLLFSSALSKAKVPFEAHIYPFGAHGLSLATEEVSQPEANRYPDEHIAGWIRECEEWIHQMFSF